MNDLKKGKESALKRNEDSSEIFRLEDEINLLKDQILVQKKSQIIIYAILNHFDKAVRLSLECCNEKMASSA